MKSAELRSFRAESRGFQPAGGDFGRGVIATKRAIGERRRRGLGCCPPSKCDQTGGGSHNDEATCVRRRVVL